MLETPVEPISIDAPFRVPRPVLRQSWLALTFLHWSFDPVVVRPLIPGELELDLWEGRIYVGLVPFILADLTLPMAPAVPWFSRFPETNLRTYVYDKQGRRGVWFFSLDAARLAAVVGARAGYALPYYWARMSVDATGGSVDYRSRRRVGPGGHTEIRVTPGEMIGETSPLAAFLTARWSLFAYRHGRVLRADIDHARWPLQRVRVGALDESLLRAAGLPDPKGEPLAHYSAVTHVMTGWRRRI
ncbi:MAG: DUF2071 domain-containing protein [Acidobacteria bacterium]|nr:DUF2071 domain-containing protein [Acidobacteriota bacterium]